MKTRSSRFVGRAPTRFEVGAVLTALGVVLGAGSWLTHSDAREDSKELALASARDIADAATAWRREGTHQGCPSLTRLQRDHALSDETPADDPWGGRYRIACDADQVTVVSPGVDGRPATDDDIRVAEPWSS